LRIVVVGIAAGLVASFALTRLLQTMLFQTGPRDPWTLAGTATLLLFVALAASYVPARRGTRVAPVEALRAE
jgi:ABC-type antimicrobial peptide transport system permease subunit